MKAIARPPRLNGAATATLQVAVYTRKSTEEGLDQEFNSLDAQRQAVESYVASQRGEGWLALPDRYDDGGFTGANTVRPAFQRLLKDVEARKVNVVAVYKIDRLSRSLLDFMRVMDLFERHGVSFVSVTQPINTTTPAGRMVLNILATFAQFERETIAERTRDKIAATRRRGMWTGGPVLLGYDLVAKKLVVNPAEAEQVRSVFKLYQDLGSVMAVVEELAARGWTQKNGGKGAYDKAAVRRLLTSPLYVGKVEYQGEVYDGAHEAILEEDIWNAVQATLKDARPERHWREGSRPGALLRGLARCGVCGSSMQPHYAQKRGRRYCSYVCTKYVKESASACPGSRVSAARLEQGVVARVREVGKDPALVADTVAAAKRELGARKPELEAELKRLDKEKQRLASEKDNLLRAIAQGGAGVQAVMNKLAETEVALHGLQGKAEAARTELLRLENQVIDEDDLSKALAAFDAIWAELFPREQARVLRLLVEAVDYDSKTGDTDITFRPGGVRTLAAQAVTDAS